MTQQRPTLRWIGAPGASPEVDLCRDRACTMPLPVGVALAADGQSAVPSSALPPGWVFWRVRFGPGAQPAVTATWQFWVGAASATSGVDTSSGAILDVNGDGYADFLVVGHDRVVHLCLGSASPSAAGWTADPSPRRIDIAPFRSAPDDLLFLADVGDVNGDGYGDFLVGASESLVGTSGSLNLPGNVRLYLGSADPSAADWNGASPPRALNIDPPLYPGQRIGATGAGDVNGDGYGDILVSGGGDVYVYLGSGKPDAAIWNAPPYALRAKITSAGISLAGAGDVNGDGYSDFLIVPGGATVDFTPPPPRLYLGSAAALGAEWNAASTRQRIDVIPHELGASAVGGDSVGEVTGIGDANGDGYSDFVLSIPGPSAEPGSHLFFGSATPKTDDLRVSSPGRRVDLLAPDSGTGYFGYPVSGAGDIDGDGITDFLVSVRVPGTVHVYLGAAGPMPPSWNGASSAQRIDLSNPDSPPSVTFGTGVAGVGDVDGDGRADFLISDSQGGLWLELGTAMPSAAVWTGASATRRIDLRQVAAL